MLGHVLVCGVLFVTYQSFGDVKGSYMLCVLFKSCLLLALANKALSSYDVVACVPLTNLAVEDADNGRGAFNGRRLISEADC